MYFNIFSETHCTDINIDEIQIKKKDSNSSLLHIGKKLLIRLLILVQKYSRNKSKMERTTDLREYLAIIFICDVSTELGHFQTAIQKKIIEIKFGSFALII